MVLYRRVRYGYAFRRIPLTQGEFALVDPWKYEELDKYKWYAHKGKGTYYAYRAARADEKQAGPCLQLAGAGKNVKMHQEVMKNKINPKSEILNPKQAQNANDQKFKPLIDHINGDGRDNREANLRLASYSQNSQNRRKVKKRCKSRYKGVGYSEKLKKWRAQICFGGMKKHLGYYSDEAAAARAYDAAALRYHGRFAKVNFPGG